MRGKNEPDKRGDGGVEWKELCEEEARMKYSYHHLDTILQTLRRRFEIIVIEEEKDYRKSTSTPCNSSIRLGTLGQSYLVALAVAHEFGHCLSFREGSAIDEDIIRRYRKRLHLTQEEKGLMIE